MAKKSDTKKSDIFGENVVLAYPYHNAMCWLLQEAAGEPRRTYPIDCWYYDTLFRPELRQLKGQAGALAALFEKIILSKADIALPDQRRYEKSFGAYAHPDLRLEMHRPTFAWGHVYGDEVEISEFSDELLSQRPVQAAVDRHRYLFPHWPQGDGAFIQSIFEQIMLAAENDAVLVGDEVFYEFYQLSIETIARHWLGPGKTVKPPLLLRLKDVECFSLNFSPANLDAFAGIRMDKSIRKYARQWRDVIASTPPPEVTDRLIALAAEASDTEAIAAKAQGVFGVLGSILTWTGPFLPGSDIAGMATDLGQRVADHFVKKKEWFMIGPKMHEIALRTFLKTWKNKRRKQGGI